jgi:hypothetical protein
MAGFGDLGPPGEVLLGHYGAADDRRHGFYIPVLSRATHYDRVSGYFTSAGLAAAAQGLATFLPGGGTMRLIVGTQLSEADVDAISNPGDLDRVLASALSGSDALDEDLGDVIHRRYREVLTWMVANGRCEIKVGLKRGPDGRPVPGSEDPNYFHHKLGVLTDATGEQVVFIGSGNETWSGWVGNSESFSVVASWWGDGWWAAQGAPVATEIDQMWGGDAGPEWMVVDLPTAIRDRLLKFAPSEMPPPRDPADTEPSQKIIPVLRPDNVPAGDLADLLVRLRESPGSGVRTAGVDPLPHQVAVLDRAFDRWPRGHLYADEVGLGKTIEVGLTIREALVRGWAERALLLVPAAVIHQWQEELAEKLALWVPRWAGPTVGWMWPDRTNTDPTDGDPWGAQWPVTLVSSHLARLRRNRDALLRAPQWDIVAVDEAHHGRRSGGQANGTPNLLLSLLQEMRREESWQTLLLATATPMQMHPHELWDLIELFDLPQGWDAEAKYEKYYDQIRRAEFATRNWRFLGSMAHAHRTDPRGGRIDPVLDAELTENITSGRLAVKNFGKRGDVPQGWAAGVPDVNRPWVDTWLLTNNPIRDRLFRNTRTTLRAYRDAGVMTATIPDRQVDDEFLDMSPEERAVYRRIRDYIRAHYNAAMTAGGSRRGLGFIMTIYRRRLTSSFLAIRCSLQRRLDVLEGRLTAREILADDDLALFDDEPTVDWNATRTSLLDGEIDELRSFIEAIDNLPHPETKLGCLIDRIDRSFNQGHRTVLVFSQYTDTVDLLAEQLNARWPGQVLAYTGAGGRRFNPPEQRWEGVGKAETKALFRAGDDVKILVGTDTLAEGLNLQTCGRLVNYDTPWNFTRVEQRIGRVDRIGGQETVEVTNLFYNRTVEATIYRTLADGFGGFNFIVGDAQPVLGDIEAAIEQAAFSDDEDDHGGSTGTGSHDTLFPVLTSLVGEIRAKINEAQAEAVRLQDLDDRADTDTIADAFPDALTLADIEAVLLADPKVQDQLTRHPDIDGSWLVTDAVGFTRAATFDRDVLNEHSPDVRLLSPGDPLFDLVIRRASSPREDQAAPALGAD